MSQGRLGRRLLADTSVTLFYGMGVLQKTVTALRDASYHVAQTDASRWLSVLDMHRDFSRILRFPDYYGENLDAFNDCMRDVVAHEYGFPEHATGLVLVLTGFDSFAHLFPDQAHGLLDIYALLTPAPPSWPTSSSSA